MDAHPLNHAAPAAGALLAAGASALAAVRPARKPLHLDGDLRTARLVTRFVLTPGRRLRSRPMTTLLPYDTGDDGTVSFDPVRHRIPGLRQYDVVPRLREPAYRRARASRTDNPTPTTEESPRVH